MTVQLKPHSLPRLIINSLTHLGLHEPEEFTSTLKKMARSGSPSDCICGVDIDLCTSGIRIGLEKGHQTTAIPKKAKPSHAKGRLSKKTQFVRSVVREVVGFAPYERRVLELLRNSKVSTLRSLALRTICVHSKCLQDKKARKLTKKRVLHPPPFCFTRTLIECFSALSSLAPFSVQNASWRNFRVSSRRAGGPDTKQIHPVAFFDYSRTRVVYHKIIASLCMHSPSPSCFRPPSHTSCFKGSSDRLNRTQAKRIRLANNETDEPMDTHCSPKCPEI